MSGARNKKKNKLIIYGIIGICVCLFLYYFLTRTNKREPIEVRQGDTFFSVAKELKEQNIIKSRLLFILFVKLSGESGKLKTGTYMFDRPSNLFSLIHVLTSGKTASKIFTIPEGFNSYQMAELLQEKGIVKKEDFIKAVQNQILLKQYKINQNTAEGFLYPETYYIPYEYKAEDIVKLMINNFFKRITPEMIRRLKGKYNTLEKAITLASLVEWEARVDYERPIIASVFINRLKKNLNLGSCATIQFALQKHKERLLFKDLKVNSPYNTYIYKGLPPTPISNPSEKSILAIIYPAKESYLYFVSMQNGRHYFSSTYSEHLKAYKQYILGETSNN